MDLTLVEVLDAVQTLGVVGLLVVIVWGGYRRWYVWGWVYEEQREELEEFKRIALRSVSAGERVAAVAEHVAKKDDR